MRGQRKKKHKEESPMLKGNKSSVPPKYHFNISADNLRCFINPSKSTKGSKRRVGAVPFKPKTAIDKQVGMVPIQQVQKIQKKKERDGHHSPDLTREVSNTILQQIQSEGVLCNWGQDTPVQLTKQQEEEDKRIWRSFSQSFECNSYASTTDMYKQPGFNPVMSPSLNVSMYHYYSSSEYGSPDCEKSKGYGPNVFDIDVRNIDNDPRTTIMIRNIPNKYSVQDLSAQIDSVMENTYDFLYLPCDLKNQCNVGYGFINLVSPCYLEDFHRQFHCKKWLKFRSEKICMLTYARLQGLEILIEHFQNSKVLNQKDKKYRPIIREMDKIQHLIKRQQGDLPKRQK